MESIENVREVVASKDGVHLLVGDKEIFIAWRVVDKIAEASEEHYGIQVLLDVMSDNKPNLN